MDTNTNTADNALIDLGSAVAASIFKRPVIAHSNMAAIAGIGSAMIGEFISQYGVVGMKWGQRRSDAELNLAAKERLSLNEEMGPGGGGEPDDEKDPYDISMDEMREVMGSLSEEEKEKLNALLRSGRKISVPGDIYKLKSGRLESELKNIEANKPMNKLFNNLGKMFDDTKKSVENGIKDLGGNISDFTTKVRAEIEDTTVVTRTRTTSSSESMVRTDGKKARLNTEYKTETSYNVFGGVTEYRSWNNGVENTHEKPKSKLQHSAMQSVADIGANFIAHYGIPGMKWGRRRSDAELARAAGRSDGDSDTRTTSGERDRVSSNRTRYKAGPKKLSDAELKNRIARLETEKRYNDLNSRTVSEGERLIRGILSDSGRQVATRALTGVGLYMLTKGTAKVVSTNAKGKGADAEKAIEIGSQVAKEIFGKKK